MFPNSEDLKEIGVWGGEPTLRLDRIYYTLEKLIPAYPNLKRINFSTNFTTNNWFEQIGGLIDVLHKFAPRVFNLDI
jgi:sulfatase maturation enzyme AslB (radical SAM superfamily)